MVIRVIKLATGGEKIKQFKVPRNQREKFNRFVLSQPNLSLGTRRRAPRGEPRAFGLPGEPGVKVIQVKLIRGRFPVAGLIQTFGEENLEFSELGETLTTKRFLAFTRQRFVPGTPVSREIPPPASVDPLLELAAAQGGIAASLVPQEPVSRALPQEVRAIRDIKRITPTPGERTIKSSLIDRGVITADAAERSRLVEAQIPAAARNIVNSLTPRERERLRLAAFVGPESLSFVGAQITGNQDQILRQRIETELRARLAGETTFESFLRGVEGATSSVPVEVGAFFIAPGALSAAGRAAKAIPGISRIARPAARVLQRPGVARVGRVGALGSIGFFEGADFSLSLAAGDIDRAVGGLVVAPFELGAFEAGARTIRAASIVKPPERQFRVRRFKGTFIETEKRIVVGKDRPTLETTSQQLDAIINRGPPKVVGLTSEDVLQESNNILTLTSNLRIRAGRTRAEIRLLTRRTRPMITEGIEPKRPPIEPFDIAFAGERLEAEAGFIAGTGGRIGRSRVQLTELFVPIKPKKKIPVRFVKGKPKKPRGTRPTSADAAARAELFGRGRQAATKIKRLTKAERAALEKTETQLSKRLRRPAISAEEIIDDVDFIVSGAILPGAIRERRKQVEVKQKQEQKVISKQVSKQVLTQLFGSSFATAAFQISEPRRGTGLRVRPITIPTTATVLKPVLDIRTDVRTSLDIITGTTTRTVLDTFGDDPFAPPRPEPPPPRRPPTGFPFEFFIPEPGVVPRRPTRAAKRIRRQFRFTPSLGGLALGVRERFEPRILAGFEIRGIAPPRKPRTRRNRRRRL